MLKYFRKKESKPTVSKPSIMGLAVGISFDVDTLGFKLIMDKLTIADMSKTQIITAAGKASMAGNTIYRFYTDDEAWLQVVCEGGDSEDHIIDVKLFHYYDTQSIDNQTVWDDLLNSKIGNPTYMLDAHQFRRVWSSVGDYAMPVHLSETTFDDSDESDTTDQFMMLFEREVDDEHMEFLFLSAEEAEGDNGHHDRCLVISTGINLSPAQITING